MINIIHYIKTIERKKKLLRKKKKKLLKIKSKIGHVRDSKSKKETNLGLITL